MTQTFLLLRSFFPPELGTAYLLALVPAVLETLGLALGAMTVVFLISVPLAVTIGVRVRGASTLYLGLSALRAIPDLTLAILCVILFGIGTGGAVIALVIYYTATVTKVFADLLETTPRGALDALSATGASRLQVALYGLLPLTRNELFDYGAFAFECALRSAVIVGAVGGGGIGAELVGSLAAFDFPRASTQILLLVAVIAGLDRFALWLRGQPRYMLALIPVGLLAAWVYAPTTISAGHAIGEFAKMFPPSLSAEALGRLPRLIWETIWMAVAGTFGAAVLGLIVALGASRRFAPGWLRAMTRRLLEFFRTVPEVVWGLVLVAVAGVGPTAGAWALGLHSFGSLGRLMADAFDSTDEAPQQNIRSTGAASPVVACYATLPLAAGPIATHVLFRLDWNLRMATVLGLIGAGGIGQALYQAQQLFFYQEVVAYVLITALLILTVDRITASLRSPRLRDRPICAAKEVETRPA